MEIHYTKRAVKAINGMDRPTKQRIKAAIEKLPDGDVKQMKGVAGLYRLRVGDWRVLYLYETKEIILIERIAPRGEIYKGV